MIPVELREYFVRVHETDLFQPLPNDDAGLDNGQTIYALVAGQAILLDRAEGNPEIRLNHKELFLSQAERQSLADWIRTSAPNGIKEMREICEREKQPQPRGPRGRRPGVTKSLIEKYFPEAYPVIFGE